MIWIKVNGQDGCSVTQIKINGQEEQFRLALVFADVLAGRERHGLIKHVRDNRKAWRKRQLRSAP